MSNIGITSARAMDVLSAGTIIAQSKNGAGQTVALVLFEHTRMVEVKVADPLYKKDGTRRYPKSMSGCGVFVHV